MNSNFEATLPIHFTSVNKLLITLTTNFIHVEPHAEEILRNPRLNTALKHRNIQLAKVTPRMLGFRNEMAHQGELFYRAEKSGYYPLSPYEIALYRLIYTEQKRNEDLYCAMEPHRFSDGTHAVLSLHAPKDVLWLCATPADYKKQWHETDMLLFKKKVVKVTIFKNSTPETCVRGLRLSAKL